MFAINRSCHLRRTRERSAAGVNRHWNRPNGFAGGRVRDLNRPFTVCRYPFTVQVALVVEKVWVFQA